MTPVLMQSVNLQYSITMFELPNLSVTSEENWHHVNMVYLVPK